MASVPVVLRQIRRARRECKKPPSGGRFRHYETSYKSVFEAVVDLAGEETLDEVAEWALEWTRQQKRLPTPEAVKKQAREICQRRGIEIPAESALSA